MNVDAIAPYHLHCPLCHWASEHWSADMDPGALTEEYLVHFDEAHRPRPIYQSDGWPCLTCGDGHLLGRNCPTGSISGGR